MVSQWLCPGNLVLLHSGPKYKSSSAGNCDMLTRSPDLLKVISFKVERWKFSTYGPDMVAGYHAWAWWHICLNLSTWEARQEEDIYKFEAIQEYTGRLCLRRIKKKNPQNQVFNLIRWKSQRLRPLSFTENKYCFQEIVVEKPVLVFSCTLDYRNCYCSVLFWLLLMSHFILIN